MAKSSISFIISVRYIERDIWVKEAGLWATGSLSAMGERLRTSTADGAVVEFGLVRHALLAALATGALSREDVCDAHPELVRAATHLGRSSGEPCPVCGTEELREVTYVFGARLPAGGACPPSRAELLKLERREEPVQCYAVEVCVSCHFHHLARKWSAGGMRARTQKKASR